MPKSQGLFFQNYLNNPRAKPGYNILSILLYPIALLYGLLMWVRRKLYTWGLLKSAKLNHPVVSVGNITTGGTGKTPFEMYLLDLCYESGVKPLLLSRGYGAKSNQLQIFVGKEVRDFDKLPDEITMIASRYPNLPIAFGADRIAAYKQAIQSCKIDLVILDDGFQHQKIKRDLDIVILDSNHPYGAGRVLPSGNLREFKSALKYANLVTINYKFGKPVKTDIKPDLKVVFEVSEIINLKGGNPVQPQSLSSLPCGLITAIGDPGSFRRILKDLKIEIKQEFVFRDHHDFTPADMREIQNVCEALKIKNLITTEKDAVKLVKISFEKPDIYVIKIQLRPVEDNRLLKQRIESLAQSNKKS